MSITTISPKQLQDQFLAGQPIVLIDVRTPAEFGDHHVSFSRNVPLDQLDPQALTSRPETPLYVICHSGGRAQQACAKLVAAGCPQVTLVTGGTQAWCQAGLPVVRGKKAISLERQVRIAAGSLVVLGSVLAAVVHPSWSVLPAVVGAGLVFAGVTDSCAMGMMLAHMPWNRGSQPTATACSR